jgi:small subunit ribosomal protein S9
MINQQQGYLKSGGRKNATARAMAIEGGKGKVIVNDKPFEEYFKGLLRQQKEALKPLEVFPAAAKYDFYVKVEGGGISGQAGAISNCLAKTILSLDESAKVILRKEGLLTRDSRMVERKKPGRPKARKRFQFSKR